MHAKVHIGKFLGTPEPAISTEEKTGCPYEIGPAGVVDTAGVQGVVGVPRARRGLPIGAVGCFVVPP